MRDQDRTMANSLPVDRYRAFRLFGVLACLSVALGACNTSGEVVTASVPDDYRLRHPIAIEEANRSIVIFVGQARAGLSATQRADKVAISNTSTNLFIVPSTDPSGGAGVMPLT